MNWLNRFTKPKPPPEGPIFDVGDKEFQQWVIERSYETPVVVDFWADWCAPCRQLTPILERLAEEPAADFVLARLDIERHRRTPAQYGILTIPAVKAFHNGQVVAEFTGALPEGLVRRFISKATDNA